MVTSANLITGDGTEQYRILDEEGKLLTEEAPDIPDERLIELYRWMVFSRAFDETCLRLQRQGRLGTYAPLSGQEAAQIGSAAVLEEKDWVFPSYRDHAALMLRGLPPEYILTYWNGSEEGSRIPEDVNVFTVAIPIATQTVHAVGFSWASKLKGEDRVVIVYFGDGGTSEGAFHEAMNFAGVFQTPTIFFCSNNHYAISHPRVKQTHSPTIAQKAVAYGMPGYQVDGNDLLAVLQVTGEAVGRARAGDGPTLIEAVTYRLGPHTTADDPRRYRKDEELEAWRKKDPIVRVRAYLESQNVWNAELEEDMKKSTDTRVREIVEKYENIPEREYTDIFENLYAEMTPLLERQRRELERVHERKGE